MVRLRATSVDLHRRFWTWTRRLGDAGGLKPRWPEAMMAGDPGLDLAPPPGDFGGLRQEFGPGDFGDVAGGQAQENF